MQTETENLQVQRQISEHLVTESEDVDPILNDAVRPPCGLGFVDDSLEGVISDDKASISVAQAQSNEEVKDEK